MTEAEQSDLFGEAPAFPPGFRYADDVIAPAEEDAVAQALADLPFRAFEFHGYLGKRRVVSFGWHYDFNVSRIEKTDDIPDFVISLREKAADFAGMHPAALQQVLITEYAPGAGIGWHKDKAVFGEVVGVSMRAPCQFRLRRRRDSGWERISLTAAPRSAYLLSGEARSQWEHSIPPVDALRYSVTFRNLRA